MDEIEISVNEHRSILSGGGRHKDEWSPGRPVDVDDDDEIDPWRSPPRSQKAPKQKFVDLDEIIPPSHTMSTQGESPPAKDGQGETSSLVDLDVSIESSVDGEENDGRDKYAVIDAKFETSEDDEGGEGKPKAAKDIRFKDYFSTRNIVYGIILLILVIGGSVTLALFKRGRLDGSKGRLDDILNDSGGENGPAMVCNGLESNCDWRVPEVMFASVHNAMSSREDGFVEWNNLFPLEDALEAGFRGLFLDVCDCPILGVHLCHTLCSGGYRRPVQVFENILSFLRENKGEVVIIELQVIDLSLVPLWNVLSTNLPELSDMMYAHPNSSVPWPYMRDLITRDQRLIVFQHDGPDCDVEGRCPYGIHNTYRYGFETPYDSRGVDELMNTTQTCVASRGDSSRPFMMSNHFAGDRIRLPAYDIALEANQAHNIIKRMEDCRDIQGRLPSMLVVDFWSAGDVVETVQKYNTERGFRTLSPSTAPSDIPSVSPSFAPTMSPSATPTSPPSGLSEPPSLQPTGSPSISNFSPSVAQSSFPTHEPTTSPANATFSPSSSFLSPSLAPTSALSPTDVPNPPTAATTTTSESPTAVTVTPSESPTATPGSTTQPPVAIAMSPPPTFPVLTEAAMSPPPTTSEADETVDFRSYLVDENVNPVIEDNP